MFQKAISNANCISFNSKKISLYQLINEISYKKEYADHRFELKLILEEFEKYAKENQYEILESPYRNDLSLFKKIELLKYIQEERSTVELVDHLKLQSNKHISSNISSFEGGVDIYDNLVILNNRMSRRIRRSSINSDEPYIDKGASVNPIGLALNHVEIFSLCEILNSLDRNSIYYNIYKNILDKIYTQLSKPAKKICNDGTNNKLKNVDLIYVAPQEMKKYNHDISWAIPYHLKSGQDIEIMFIHDGQILKKQGSIDIIKKPYILTTNDGEIYKIKPEDIQSTGFIKK